MEKYEVIKFEYNNIKLNVNVSPNENTVWLSKEQISLLFDRDRSVISRHIKNIFESNELDEKSNVHFLHIANSDKPVLFYSSDVVIYVGYRVKSSNGIIFKKWAEETLDRLNNKVKQSDIIVFNNNDIVLDVKIMPEDETVYLTKEQMSILFGRNRSVISRHIHNIFLEGELDENRVCAKNAHTGPDGKNYIVDFYNLDVIISVGYRVKSPNGVVFRKWALSVLKEYLLKGYVINEKRTLVTNENYINLIHKVENIDNRLCALEKSETIKNEKIFYDGSFFDARLFIKIIFNEANKEIVLIDPYSDIETLDVLKDKRSGVKVVLYTSSKAKITKRDVDSFNSQYGNLSINIVDSFHDRFIIVDDSILFHVGASINYAGKKAFAITKMIDKESLALIKNRLI